MENVTIATEFILLGFSLIPNTAVSVFYAVLFSYIITMAGNFLIITLVSLNIRLHRPMYFFLCNLAIIDICFINTTVPQMLKGILGQGKTISLTSCFTQLCAFFLIGTAEFLLLAVMSLDRFLAICCPLNYGTIMNSWLCVKLTAGVWLGSFILNCVPATLIMRLSFCFKEIDHFFCDVGPLLKNACTDTTKVQILIAVTSSLLFFSFFVTLVSYINIVIAVLKIKSGRGRVISTCTSHAVVVFFAYGSCIFMYSKPANSEGFNYNKRISILNTIVVPLINPFIYTLRNQDVREMIVLCFSSRRLEIP